MQKSPPPFIWACPEEKNILDCMLSTFPLDPLTDWFDRALYHRKLGNSYVYVDSSLIIHRHYSVVRLIACTQEENITVLFGSLTTTVRLSLFPFEEQRPCCRILTHERR